MEPEVIMPLSTVPVSDWDQLRTEIDLAGTNGTVVIEVTGDILSTAAMDGSAIQITGGRNVTITSGLGGPFTLYQEVPGERHFLLINGTLTLQSITLSGNVDLSDTSDTDLRGGVEFGALQAGSRQLNMEAGSAIINNRFGEGGGVRVRSSGTFYMSPNATISGNESTMSGGGIHIAAASTFTMIGGSISGNVSIGGGGGIHLMGSSAFYMLNGEIRANHARGGSGGGLHAMGSSTFSMATGTIRDNTASVDGGGVSLLAPASAGPLPTTFEMLGGEIRGNDAVNTGGGIALQANSSFTMQAGEIFGNFAQSGGGVNIHSPVITPSTFTMWNGEIHNNTARGTLATAGGGGVNIQGGFFIMQNGTIRDNLSEGYGGGVRRGPGVGVGTNIAYFTMHNGAIRNNTAAGGDGGGLFAHGGDVFYNQAILPPNAYPRIAIGPDAIFSGNRAGNGAFRPPDDTSAVDYRIQTTSATLFGSPFNNFDINFRMPPRMYNIYVTYLTDVALGTFDAPGAPDERVYAIPVDTAAGLPFLPPNIPTVTEVTAQAFTGWVQDGYNNLMTSPELSVFPITDDTTFIAQYGYTNHIVTFWYNYPRPTPIYLAKTIVHGNPVLQPANPERLNYVFEGWYLTPAGTPPSYNFTLPIEGDLDLYARWSPVSGGGGGGGGSGPGGRHTIHHNFLIGDTDGLIRPHGNITRAEVASIFLRIISDDERAAVWSQTNPYPDVVLANWFNNAVSTTSNAGLFQGLPSGEFGPNLPITRAELVTVVARFMNVEYDGEDLFSDIQNHWARPAINAVAHAGWIQGQTGLNGTFQPNNPITRAETAAVINRMLNRLPEGPDDLLEGMRTWPDNTNPNAWYYLYIQETSNSHRYVRKADGIHEKWVELVPDRPWELLQRPDSRPEDIFRTTS